MKRLTSPRGLYQSSLNAKTRPENLCTTCGGAASVAAAAAAAAAAAVAAATALLLLVVVLPLHIPPRTLHGTAACSNCLLLMVAIILEHKNRNPQEASPNFDPQLIAAAVVAIW